MKQGPCCNGGVQLLPLHGGCAAKLTSRDLNALGLQCGTHIIGGQPVVVQLAGVQPDPHGVLEAERLQFTYSFEPAYDILDVGNQIVGQLVTVHGAVFGNKSNQYQIIFGRLDYCNPLLLNDLRQKRRGQL